MSEKTLKNKEQKREQKMIKTVGQKNNKKFE